MATKGTKKQRNGNGANLGFEAQLWAAADALRNNMDAAEYKHVVLGLIFLKYISDAFEERHAALEAERKTGADPEDPDEYRAVNVFWVPAEARWQKLKDNAHQPTIGKIVDDAMVAIERDNPTLKGVLPKDYARPGLDKERLGQLIDLVSNIGLGDQDSRSKDVLGRVYEYFLTRFASAEGKNGGQFYTPRSVVQLLVEMLAPYKGRVYDPCCGSGGMFVQSEKFIEQHGGRIGQISVFGQESNYTTWRLAKMNLAIRGIDGKIEQGDSFHNDKLPDLKADYVLANPPFNDSDWRGDQLKDDKRWKYGTPPPSNANFAWVQHFISHLAPNGIAGFVMAIGSMASNTSGEGDIRKAIIEADLVDCMVVLPSQLFYSTQIPVCLWFVARDKKNNRLRDRRGKVLFIDARNLGSMVDRTHRELAEPDIAKIAGTYRAWRGDKGTGKYADVAGFSKSVELSEVVKRGYVLTPDRYVDAEAIKNDGEPFDEKMTRLAALFRNQQAAATELDSAIATNMKAVGLDLFVQRARDLGDFARMGETLEGLARALFKSWFVDFDPVRARAEGRDLGLPKRILRLFPDSFEDSELGRIPKGWEVRPLDKIATFLNGLALQKFPPNDGRSLPVIKIAELRAGHTAGADRASADIDPQYVVRDGDILFSWSGSLECILWTGGPGALNQHLFKVSSTTYPKWMCYLGVLHHLGEFRRIAAGKATTMGHIQRHHLSEAKLAVPGEALLKVLDSYLSSLIERSWRLRVESRTLGDLRDALLPGLISGELQLEHVRRILGGIV
jgi:type I restriction enzyme M protein